MKTFVLASLLVVAVSASLLGEHGTQFQAFKLAHGKTYSNQVEETKRFAIFRDNLRDIEEHNLLYAKGLVSYKKAVNKFSDLSPEEFRAFLSLHAKPTIQTTPYVKKGIKVPAAVDWRNEGYVTDVKDQGSCGSCWAFSLTGATEGAYAKSSGTLVSLSEQQLVDCTKDFNYGCDGGFLDQTFTYIETNGLESEADYPYTAEDGQCQYDASKVVAKTSRHVSIREDENSLLEAVANQGPVSVAIDASYLSSYSSGIYSDNYCSPSTLNHGVLIVGYGNENGQDYWIVKNSWGDVWGEQGYFRLLRGTNECGVAEDDVYPIIILQNVGTDYSSSLHLQKNSAMKTFILTSLLIVAVGASLLEEHQVLFETFKSAHGKTYSEQENARRFTIFRDNLRSIQEHNALYARGLVSYNKTVTKFSDWTSEEFRSYLTLHAKPARSLKTTPFVKTGAAIPAFRDWRSEGYVTEVKNQGACGSCWAFSATGSTEGAYFKSSGKLVPLSEKQLVDCCSANDGCSGGSLDDTFPYIEEYGLESGTDYPTTGDGTCKYDASKVVTKISSYECIDKDEEALLEAVGTVGPVSAVVDASYLALYASGIYSDPSCSFNNLNHGVLIVGYGSENGQDYWIVKNSWGPSWGEQGYFRLLRGTNECGIAEDDVYPIV
ncbi:uncharacterized protein [Euwallacea fornicatus]|uniref:uncharacterized protein n=1 Tax=Euwallacea fornicatus TaxID=995702 RepID=UPI00338DAC13